MKYLLLISVMAVMSFFNLPDQVCNLQTNLSGSVKDNHSGEAIPFVSIALYKNNVLLTGTETDFDGKYIFTNIEPGIYDLEASYVGYKTKRIERFEVKVGQENVIDFQISEGILSEEIVVIAYSSPLIEHDNTTTGGTVTAEEIRNLPTKNITNQSFAPHKSSPRQKLANDSYIEAEDNSNENYAGIQENTFKTPQQEALSTFSIDVDRASYSNVRRYINNGLLPPVDAVKIEEMINYFDYEYDGPEGKDPFAIHNTLTTCPWNTDHQIMHIGLQGKNIDTDDLPASNLVFLVDVSGSMQSHNKLPLLKSSFKLLINQLREKDKVAIVVYAGAAGLVLPSTSGDQKQKIFEAIDKLKAGGSTAGGAGIKLAYKTAREQFIKKGNNRVILATDGDFNVGQSSDEDMESLIEKQRESGVFLSVLGYGMGNYKDSKMETLADKGNGNHAYIDNIQEAKKVFVNEFSGTLFTIAKDVKIQVEFNPVHIQAYRLIGYENRLLDKEDFNDDTKDAGELGAGHVVTAMYEVIPTGVESNFMGSVDNLKYQDNKKAKTHAKTGEIATVKLRYKQPDGDKSKKIVRVVKAKDYQERIDNDDVNFSLAVAEFGMLLRQSKYIGNIQFGDVIQKAKSAKGSDKDGYRSEFIRLVETVDGYGDLASQE